MMQKSQKLKQDTLDIKGLIAGWCYHYYYYLFIFTYCSGKIKQFANISLLFYRVRLAALLAFGHINYRLFLAEDFVLLYNLYQL